MLCTFKKKAIKIHNKSIHHTPQVLTWKTLKEVKTTGPSPELIHYQDKLDTPKFYSKQVRVL